MSEAAKWLRELSEPWDTGEKIKSAIDKAARLSGLSYWRAFDIWYRKARKVEDYEIAQIAEALHLKNERAARNELHQAKLLLARLEARLNAGDTDFYRADIDGLRQAASGTGGSNPARKR